MPSYVAELYRPNSDAESLRSSADRLAATARQLSEEGASVRYVDTIFLPSDETCLHLFEAGSEADVRALARRAGIDVDRVVPFEQIEPRDAGSRPKDRTRPCDDENRTCSYGLLTITPIRDKKGRPCIH